jgi:hypothetical protein
MDLRGRLMTLVTWIALVVQTEAIGLHGTSVIVRSEAFLPVQGLAI